MINTEFKNQFKKGTYGHALQENLRTVAIMLVRLRGLNLGQGIAYRQEAISKLELVYKGLQESVQREYEQHDETLEA